MQNGRFSWEELLDYFGVCEIAAMHGQDQIDAAHEFADCEVYPLKSSIGTDTGVVIITDTKFIWSIDGSSTTKEWLGNVFGATKSKQGFHSNFEAVAQAMFVQIWKLLLKNLHKTIISADHSRGYGIATKITLMMMTRLLLRNRYETMKNMFTIGYGGAMAMTKQAMRDYSWALNDYNVFHLVEGYMDFIPELGLWWQGFRKFCNQHYKCGTQMFGLDHTSYRPMLERKVKETK